MNSLETQNVRVRMDRREAQRRPCCSRASRSRTAEIAWPAFLRRQRASTAASQISQEKWPKHVWPPLWRGRMTSRLKTILSWYEGADRGCRHEIFGDIFLLAFGSSAARGLVDFQTYDAEQAFLPGLEHARSGVSRARDIADHCGKFVLELSGKCRLSLIHI